MDCKFQSLEPCPNGAAYLVSIGDASPRALCVRHADECVKAAPDSEVKLAAIPATEVATPPDCRLDTGRAAAAHLEAIDLAKLEAWTAEPQTKVLTVRMGRSQWLQLVADVVKASKAIGGEPNVNGHVLWQLGIAPRPSKRHRGRRIREIRNHKPGQDA